MDGDDSYYRLSSSLNKQKVTPRVTLSDRKLHSLNNSKQNSGSLLSRRHRRKLSNDPFLVARKSGKNSYNMSEAQKLEIINHQVIPLSNSRYRRMCFRMRFNIIVYPMS
jgi:hypothetical protein